MSIEFFCDIGSNFISIENNKPSLNRALSLIERAADIGCTGVKFQYFKANKLWNRNKFPQEYEAALKRELPFEWIPVLYDKANSCDVLFGLSVFDIEDIEKVNPYVDYFKIASFEAGWFDLIKTCFMTGKRLMLSLGQIDRNEIQHTIASLPVDTTEAIWIDILHCVSNYPTKLKDCNLGIIKTNPVINGWSDHTTERAVIFAAVMAGAKVIEFHFDDGFGIEKGHSWTPWIISSVIETVKDMEVAMGSDNWDEVVKKQDRTYKADSKTGIRGGIDERL